MIEIIKRGTKIITECKKCGCKFSFDREDVQKKYTMIDECGVHREYVMCPQCDEELIICQTR